MVLVQSIFFQAPRAYMARNERLKRQIHLHNEHALRLQEAITGFRNFQTAEYAKFSLLYLHCGYDANAEELQVQVKDYILANLGPESKYDIDTALSLSHNLVLQARNNQSQVLQYQVLESTKKYYGPDHPSTSQITDTLGATRLSRSRSAEANQSHEQAIAKSSNSEGFGLNTRIHGELWITFPRLSFAILAIKRRSSCNCKLMRGWRGSWVLRLKNFGSQRYSCGNLRLHRRGASTTGPS
ncbi:hypothetical protein H634G_05507 [Metarhizium anisopliae BRIP 53293]|uniref:Uncharacterized protein n=1 Tax=Metarhizium anisopliae BRIP 53293 TaxID=1291518 RepID=A0A0D9NYY1_METAN|nr:hypothetical protein H634G_05507 [Metarhizium anisopliae BRIP 53293]KJK95588.1 hypothetical protein H633G_00545 [Metarhizium anisopliae BRIP 53284]